MPQTLIAQDFSAGWIPSDDRITGRKNGWADLQNVELEKNGAVRLTGGSLRLGAPYQTAVRDIYVTYMNGLRTDYAGDRAGVIYRDRVVIASGGSADDPTRTYSPYGRTAFGDAFNFTLIASAGVRLKDTGTGTPQPLGFNTPGSPSFGTPPTTELDDTAPLVPDTFYEWVQVNVSKNGSYVGKSMASAPLSITYTGGANGFANIQPNVTGLESTVNEIWIFRRGGGLDQYYRTMVIKPPVQQTNGYPDMETDDDALAENVILNLNLISVAASSLTDDILTILGPMEGRWFYFTKDTIYPSEINNPDLIDVSRAVKINGSNSEVFLWAIKVAEATILVSTTKDNYVLSGTFQTYPDFSIDIYYRPLGIKHPCVIRQVAAYNGIAYSLAIDGWRGYDANGQDVSLVFPSTDVLYSGEGLNTRNGTSIKWGGAPGSYYYPCAIANEKLYCAVFGRVEVWHIARKYWGQLNYTGVGICSSMCSIPGGGITGVIQEDHIQRDFDMRDRSTLSAVGKQSMFYTTVFYDTGTPSNRKDALTVKWHGRLGVSDDVIGIEAITEGNVVTHVGDIHYGGANLALVHLDARHLPISRYYAFLVHGTVNDFEQEYLSLDYELRPSTLTSFIIRPSNFGSSTEKRIRAWPHVIDTLGNDVTFTPNVDNVPFPSEVINSNYKKTWVYQFTEDAFGVDYGAVLTGGPFEYWGTANVETDGNNELAGQPYIVESLPQGVKFDQVGPDELARYGKIMQFDVRIRANGTQVPWKMYFDDNTMSTGIINTRPNQDWVYNVSVPKGMGGHVVRFELGPADQEFHRYYLRALVARSGGDTQNEWINVGSGKKK